MRFISPLLWISLAAAAVAAPKFAVVRVTDIYRDLPSTAAMRKNLQTQRKAIANDKRAERLREIIEEMKSIESQLKAKRDEPESDTVKSLVNDFEIKRQEAETLRQEFEEFRSTEEKRINIEMVGAMRSSLDRITAAAGQLAKERNFDAVLDTSGNSNTGVPFVLYSGKSVDLTEDVVALIGEKPLDESVGTPEPASQRVGPPGD